MKPNTRLDELRHEDRPLLLRLAIRSSVFLGLLYLSAPISDLAHSSLPRIQVVGISIGLAVFVAIYWSLMPPIRLLAARDDRWTLAALTALFAIAAGLLLAHAPASCAGLFIYAVAAAGLVLPPRSALPVIAVTALGVGAGMAATGAEASAVTTWTLTIVSIGGIMVAIGWMAHANGELRQAREDLARVAVSEERLRIARDLHDLLGHSLSLIALKTDLATKLVRHDAERTAAELADIEQVTRRALVEVRAAVRGYRNLALEEALEGARVSLAAAGIDCHLEERRLAVPPEVEAVLAWAVREGTTNVVRHSRAHHCEIRVQTESGLAAIEVENDGDGPVSTVAAGNGLTGLAERARAVSGTLEAGPRRNGGFRLRLAIPLAES
ncbi:MAG TPA: sensor histidine kinase [Gaiellaceae bacterium]|jgi:two-component system sensor histidine kinase DesK|nr:sensor histidine kinase [Gaiellaceae bacterium]